ncbi:3-galactosyl-N-acetylglucosaminide 4-alpha-L-fucosyltransferase FUT3-like [Rhinophrynus dorsalis]
MASKSLHRNILIILPLLFFVFLLSYAWRKQNIIYKILECHETEQDTKVDMQDSTNKNEKDLLILVWVYPFRENFLFNVCQSAFGVSGCNISADRELYNIADALVIHHVDIMDHQDLIPKQQRPRHQRWVWFNLEPPLIIRNLHILDNLFNMTMTFRQDSDIYRPYGRVELLKEPQNFTIPPKSKLVAWVVSKWYPGIRRTKYYNELKEYIPIDVYGKNRKKLSWDDFNSTLSQYKFYLAFENSAYKDYITEKFWRNAVGSWAVPVVLGTSRSNYEQFVPRDSFIHVDDFPSAKELADFLLKLDKDDESYKKYFKWRSHYQVRIEDRGWSYHYCMACKGLKQATDYQVIPSVAKWFLDVKP